MVARVDVPSATFGALADHTFIEENLKRTPEERLQALQAMVDLAKEVRRAREARRSGLFDREAIRIIRRE